MCKHCERLVEDVEYKKLIHDFMAATAMKINQRKIPHLNLEPITADDLEIEVQVNAKFRGVHSILRDMYK